MTEEIVVYARNDIEEIPEIVDECGNLTGWTQ